MKLQRVLCLKFSPDSYDTVPLELIFRHFGDLIYLTFVMVDKDEDPGTKEAGGAQAAGDEGIGDDKEDEGLPTYPLIVQCDINPEWSEDVVDKVNNYFEKFGMDFEVFAKTIKTYMDDKYAVEGKWNVVVGDSFSIDMFCNKNSLVYLLIGGTTAVILWKCP